MALNSYKITSGDISRKGVVAAPDRLTGNAQQNKMVFDRLIREAVAELHNSLIDALTGTGGAAEIGVSPVEGMSGGNIQQALINVQSQLDSKASTEEMDADLARKSDIAVTDLHFKSVSFDAQTGVFTFTRENGSYVTCDTALEKVATNWQYDAATQSLVLTLIDGSTQTVPLSAFITETEFQDSTQIDFSVSNHKVTATIKNGSITTAKLDNAVYARIAQYANDAYNAYEDARYQARLAGDSADRSASYASESQHQAGVAQTYANIAGEKAHDAGDSAQNAASSASEAASSVSAAASFASAAATSAASAATSEQQAAESKAYMDSRMKDGIDKGLLVAKTVSTTLSAANWSATNTQTLTFPAGTVTADQDGSIHIAKGATDAQVDAAADAELWVTAQTQDSVTITAYGARPTIDLPVELYLYFPEGGFSIDAGVLYAAATKPGVLAPRNEWLATQQPTGAAPWDLTAEYALGSSFVWPSSGSATVLLNSPNIGIGQMGQISKTDTLADFMELLDTTANGALAGWFSYDPQSGSYTLEAKDGGDYEQDYKGLIRFSSTESPYSTTTLDEIAEKAQTADMPTVTGWRVKMVDGAPRVIKAASGYVQEGQVTTTPAGQYATAEGRSNTASGQYAHAEGRENTSSADSAHTEGWSNTASGEYAHAEGSQNTVTSISSHAEGQVNTVNGVVSHAEGRANEVHGWLSHAEGYMNVAGRAEGTAIWGAHAEGYYNVVEGNYSHAEGMSNYITGATAHAEGTANEVHGECAHAEGDGNKATHRAQHVFGMNNVADPSTAAGTERGTYVEIVGNGTSDSARSNARTLDWDGNETLSGKLTLGAAPTGSMDAATKQYVDSAIAALRAELGG